MTTDITTTLKKRGKRYGEFKGNAQIAQALKRWINLTNGLQAIRDYGLTDWQPRSYDPACGTGGVLLQNPPWAGGWE